MSLRYKRITLALAAALFVSPFGAHATESPKYKADVPSSLQTPDKVQTELLGELDFTDGMPSEATVKKTYDFLDL
ncbi:MAG: hypothetical protein OEV88_19305, partial [Gammaproteobacteria bacterium]|nr:hypothetical protein [Gammaproteobacteria bacterium]